VLVEAFGALFFFISAITILLRVSTAIELLFSSLVVSAKLPGGR
jgi:hypothetical protein